MSTNIDEYSEILLKLSTYESRRDEYKAQVAVQKLKAAKELLDLGVDPSRLAALGVDLSDIQ